MEPINTFLAVRFPLRGSPNNPSGTIEPSAAKLFRFSNQYFMGFHLEEVCLTGLMDMPEKVSKTLIGYFKGPLSVQNY